jgi:membrane-associated protein
MDLITTLFDLLLHFDQHLTAFVAEHGAWVYVLLIAIVFAETGLVVMPWLPGDSLLFVVGTLAGMGSIDYTTITLALMAASFIGDTTNYLVGRFVGVRLFVGHGRLLKQAHLDYTRGFYESHGGKTIVIARFLPIIRTFAPFVAGIAHMSYPRFAAFSIAGSILWVGSLVTAGYFFGNLPWVKDNLTIVILGIIAISLLPGAIGYLRHRAQRLPVPAKPQESE